MGKAASSEERKGLVNARQIDLERLYSMYTAATTSAERLQIGQELQQELQQQLAVDQIHESFLALVFPGDEAKQEACATARPSLPSRTARSASTTPSSLTPHSTTPSTAVSLCSSTRAS